MKELGIRILSFNVQNVNDKDGLIDDLGIDNRETIRKTARVAKANADREIYAHAAISGLPEGGRCRGKSDYRCEL